MVLDEGRVVAEGAHEELLARSPLYREYAQIQLAATEPIAAVERVADGTSRR